jgi:small subunit ribosomal protein S8
MMMIDPIANLVVSVKNASRAGKPSVTVASSRMIKDIVKVLHAEGYIKDSEITKDGKKEFIKINLKYDRKTPVITDFKQVSKPGLRIYRGKATIPHVLNGLGTAIVTTSKGIHTDKYARANNLGGEVIALV